MNKLAAAARTRHSSWPAEWLIECEIHVGREMIRCSLYDPLRIKRNSTLTLRSRTYVANITLSTMMMIDKEIKN